MSQTFCLGEIRWKLNLQHSDHMPDALHGQLSMQSLLSESKETREHFSSPRRMP